jgi:hypothetical protein
MLLNSQRPPEIESKTYTRHYLCIGCGENQSAVIAPRKYLVGFVETVALLAKANSDKTLRHH